ncbi:MAG: ammonia channel protein, partial [Vallitaleaceae bacterium]|nr:ammonia channel protein [Vallitaleaceae bacterium]
MKKYILSLLAMLTLFSIPALAQDAAIPTPTINAGDTAWMIVAIAFVLMMSIPGLALFYGGLVRRKNILSEFMQIFILVGVIT